MIVTINDDNVKKRLDVFICEYFKNEFTRAKTAKIIELGYILVNKIQQKNSYKLKNNDVIEILENEIKNFFNQDKELKPFDFNLDIIYQDEYLAVINKPKNMICHPTKHERENTLCNALIYNFGLENLSNLSDERPGIIHRLDKNTSGLIIIAKNNFAHENLSKQIKEKTAKRKYKAIALGEFEKKQGTINKPLVHYLKENVKMTIAKENEGLEAITDFRVLEEFKGATLVELELKTGRTHQIRAHLKSVNHPIVGDELYLGVDKSIKTNGQLLFAYKISFVHPTLHKTMTYSCDLPDYFQKVLDKLQ